MWTNTILTFVLLYFITVYPFKKVYVTLYDNLRTKLFYSRTKIKLSLKKNLAYAIWVYQFKDINNVHRC